MRPKRIIPQTGSLLLLLLLSLFPLAKTHWLTPPFPFRAAHAGGEINLIIILRFSPAFVPGGRERGMDARAPTLEKVRNLGRRNGGGRRKRKGGGGENNRPEVFLVIVRFF